MAVRQPRYNKEEFACRGNQLYEAQVRSQVEEDNHGRVVAIDLEPGTFSIDGLVWTLKTYSNLALEGLAAMLLLENFAWLFEIFAKGLLEMSAVSNANS